MRIPFTYTAEKELHGVPCEVEAEGLMGYACGEMNIELHDAAVYIHAYHVWEYRRGAPDNDVSCPTYNQILNWIESDEEARLMSEWRTANKSTR